MKFMLDTNICIYLIKHRDENIIKHLRKCSPGEVGISSITVAELQYGIEKSQRIQQNREALEEFMLPLETLSFDGNAAKQYGIVRADLEKAGTPIGSMDMLIAAHAASIGVTLVTHNTREFKRIKKLKIADWTL
ncbi:MAG: type II toxin-antitoxin system VapC family toxin [Myxococcota bacterium]|jgi:tRNA(fMet)-specific endonuclease VapC